MATVRQRKAIQKMSENIGNQSAGEILRRAGYSESVSKTPNRVFKTKGWKQLMEEYFPDEMLLKAHTALLNKQEIVAYQGGFVQTGQPHSDVKYALDLIYKLKGHYQNTEINHVDKSGRTHFENMTREELDEYEKKLREEHKLLYDRWIKYGRRRNRKKEQI